MFKLSSRRYTGAKTRLLSHIESVFLKHLNAFDGTKNLSFFDVFAGTGVVSEHFMKCFLSPKTQDKRLNDKIHFSRFLINDFLHSNFAIYQGFFAKMPFEMSKLQDIAKTYKAINGANLSANYYSKSYGGLFFSDNDAKTIGQIRDDLDALLNARQITQKEFCVLLASLIYSTDRVANTVGHYDAYRKNAPLCDRFEFELIEPVCADFAVEIFKEDANVLAKNLAKTNDKIDLAFIDPPYNSRQYARFYHLLETLSKNDKPKLYGVAKKPMPENVSEYCKSGAKWAFENLVQSLAKCSKILLVTYNNTYVSKSSSSHNKITLEQIQGILSTFGKVFKYEFDFKAFTSGKTEFKDHKEMIFVCEVRKNE